MGDADRPLGRGQTPLLVTTHYLDEADGSGAVAIVDRGRIVAEGTSDHLKAELEGDSVVLDLGDAQQVPTAS